MDWPDICDLVYGVNPMQSFKATPKTDGDPGRDLAFVFSQGSQLNSSSCTLKTKPTACKAEVSQPACASRDTRVSTSTLLI